MNENLTEKIAVVIGGTSSVGLEVAVLLNQKGMKVTAFGRNTPQIDEKTKGIEFISYDFTKVFSDADSKATKDFFEKISSCDILVNCYGPFVQKSLEETTFEDWNLMANMNYNFTGILISSVLKNMKTQKFGRIVLFGGTRTESVKSYSTNAAYAGSKTGIAVLVKSVAANYQNDGITCNMILPGFTRNCPSDTKLITNKMLAEKVLFLIENEELNGVLLNVDRGWKS